MNTTSNAVALNVTAAQTAHAYRMLLLVVIVRPLGNVALAWGMKHSAEVLSPSPLAYLQAVGNPFVAIGLVLLVLALLIRMAMLSISDLSLVVPLTASGYIFTTLMGRFVLSEQVSREQWAGTVLIFLGASLVTSEKMISKQVGIVFGKEKLRDG